MGEWAARVREEGKVEKEAPAGACQQPLWATSGSAPDLRPPPLRLPQTLLEKRALQLVTAVLRRETRPQRSTFLDFTSHGPSRSWTLRMTGCPVQ